MPPRTNIESKGTSESADGKYPESREDWHSIREIREKFAPASTDYDGLRDQGLGVGVRPDLSELQAQGQI